MRTGREEWRKRVERWKDSGLTAEQYAAALGIKVSTLKYWKYELGRPMLAQRDKPARSPREASPSFIALQPIVIARAAILSWSSLGGACGSRQHSMVRDPRTPSIAPLQPVPAHTVRVTPPGW